MYIIEIIRIEVKEISIIKIDIIEMLIGLAYSSKVLVK